MVSKFVTITMFVFIVVVLVKGAIKVAPFLVPLIRDVIDDYKNDKHAFAEDLSFLAISIMGISVTVMIVAEIYTKINF